MHCDRVHVVDSYHVVMCSVPEPRWYTSARHILIGAERVPGGSQKSASTDDEEQEAIGCWNHCPYNRFACDEGGGGNAEAKLERAYNAFFKQLGAD